LTHPKTSLSGYLPTLDGWRAVAILLVIGCHDRLRQVEGVKLLWFKEEAGVFGVDLFFVLSGLLICSRLLQEERLRGRIDFKGFYIRRICRIQPAALVYLAAIGLLIAAGAISRTNNGVLSALLLTRNYVPAISTGDAWYTAHFWSLAIEEHYYLLVPALVGLVRRRRATMLLAILVVLEALHTLVGSRAIHELQSDLEGIPIIVGALVAVLLTREEFLRGCVRFLEPWWVLPLMLGIWVRQGFHSSRFDYPIFIASLALAIVSTMLHPERLWGRLLETRVLKYIGRISYSLYLWQELFFPYIDQVRPLNRNPELTAIQHSWMRYLALPVVAALSYHLIERPLIKAGHRLAKPATPGRDDQDEVPSAAASEASVSSASDTAPGY
jgi:peptidoglycan/LPS O-acetylase OafA/YrhL